MKQAQITINLTWIFALIAGFLVFALIIVFIYSQKEESETTGSATILENIETEIKAVSKTRNTFSIIETPRINLMVLCDDPQSSGIMLEKGSNAKSTAYQPIFSEKSLAGNEFMSWTKDWLFPNYVDTFLYLSNTKTLFIIIRDDELHWKKFTDGIPEQFPKIILNLSELQDIEKKGYETYKIILFGRSRSEIESSGWQFDLESEPKIIVFNPETLNIGGAGRVDFYSYNSSTGIGHNGNSLYAGLSLLYGAVFSESYSHYECNKEKALFRLRLLIHINKNRATAIMQSLAEGNSECIAWFNDNGETPSNACNECLIMIKDINLFYEELISGIENKDMDAVEYGIGGITQVSGNLAKGRDCPTI